MVDNNSMTYNLGTVRTRVEQRLDDTSFGSAKLNQFINDAQRDILNSRRFTFMEREADVTTVIGSDTISGQPTDMAVPLHLRVYTPVGNAIMLDYMEYEDFDRAVPNINNVGSTAPSAWRIFNNTIYVYPLANAEYALKLKYVKNADELTGDASVPEIPEAFSEILVLGAYKRALEHNDDFDLSQVIQSQIDELADKMDERYKRQAGFPHIMRQPNRTTRTRRF